MEPDVIARDATGKPVSGYTVTSDFQITRDEEAKQDVGKITWTTTWFEFKDGKWHVATKRVKT